MYRLKAASSAYESDACGVWHPRTSWLEVPTSSFSLSAGLVTPTTVAGRVGR